MTLSSTMTVREVALELPQATRVFESMNIDYCCGGDKPLEEACATAGVDVEEMVRMLEEFGQVEVHENDSLDFQKASLTELITHILDKHHVYTKQEMARLSGLAEKVIGAHGENYPELRQIGELFQRLCADLKPHMFKEEEILFPYIVQLESAHLQGKPAPFAPFGTVKNPVRMMMTEHEMAGEILRELRQTSSDYAVPADGCISYQTFYQALEAFEKDLHQHIHLENNVLFPRAMEMEGKR
ncbi:MAG: iron-sulfur cluster repair di-iron protein [Pyrinomonadaceae bacterium]